MQIDALSVEEIQTRIEKIWGRYEKDLHSEMAPLLFHLKKKLKTQGSRNGLGWSAWVEAYLGISLRTADRWVQEYGESAGLLKPRAEQTTSGQMSRSPRLPSAPPDGKVFVLVQLGLAIDRKEQFDTAWKLLQEVEDRGVDVVFEAVLAAAGKIKKNPHRVPMPVKKTQKGVTVQ